MRPTVASPAVRAHEKSRRSDSHERAAALDEIRAGSHMVRIDAKTEFLAVINEIRTRRGLSIEAMAINAECPASSMSDALAGKDGRNFAGQWLVAQGPEFVKDFNDEMERRLGVTQASIDEQDARDLGRLVEMLSRRMLRARAVNE